MFITICVVNNNEKNEISNELARKACRKQTRTTEKISTNLVFKASRNQANPKNVSSNACGQ